MRTPTGLALALLLLSPVGCGGDDGAACEIDESYDPQIDPAQFSAVIDNPLFPLTPGTIYTYEGGGETVVVEVTTMTKVILGVTTVVVRDSVTVDGEVVENTFDWYAQDVAGNVWYFGEDTAEYEGGMVVSTEGSWEAGFDGAKPGIAMPAQPAVGMGYRQEYYACEAEDEATVEAIAEAVSVPYGDFTGCLKTRDFTRLDTAANEYKWYCPGAGTLIGGFVAEEDINTGTRLELISVTTM